MSLNRASIHLLPRLMIAAALFVASSTAAGDLAEGFDDALGAADRSPEDKARDAARRPGEVLEFLGIGAGMSVLDVSASTGWYTEVLSAAVGSEGTVISHNSVRRQERSEPAIAERSRTISSSAAPILCASSPSKIFPSRVAPPRGNETTPARITLLP